MQENNFEKQVQQKIDGLSFDPSGEVWQKVAVAIGKRKNDRHIILIIFLLLLATGSGIFMIAYQKGDKKISKSISAKDNLVTNETASTQKHAGRIVIVVQNSVKENKIKEITSDKNATNKSGIANKSLMVVGMKKAVSAPDQKDVAYRKFVDGQSKEAHRNDLNKISSAKLPEISSPVISGPPAGLDEISIADKGIHGDKASTPLVNEPAIIGQNGAIKKDTIETADFAKTAVTITPKTANEKDTIVKALFTPKHENKWKVGIAFSGGITTTQNSYLGVISLGNADESKALFSAPSQSTGNTGGSTIPRVPSKLTPGFGYSLGIYLQKSISNKTNILIGLNYKTYTSAIVVGNAVNSSANFSTGDVFYSSGNTNKYRNHFHFIELPVVARFNVRKQNKLPVYLNAGFSIAQLLGSNALQFDTLTGNYYSNNTVFNKTPVNVSAGILFTLPWHAINPILIGPDINFSISKMAKTGLYQNRRYSYFGIRLQKTFSTTSKK